MRPALIFNLASVLFKSYLRASSAGRRGGAFSRPLFILLLDLIAFAIPFALLTHYLPQIPADLTTLLEPIAWQALVGLPIMLTSAIIVAGIMFELGQSGGISSSEAVNWLPITQKEYVAASALSVIAVYSPIYAISLGVTLPLALSFGLIQVLPAVVFLSALGLLLGALIVEILKATMNRVSFTVYRKSGRLGVVSRLLLLIILFVIIQLAFNPYILYRSLLLIVGGVNIFWFIPMVWPSVAIMDLIRFETLLAIVFTVLSIAFTSLIFAAASNLRQKYWAPASISIAITSSTKYIPHAPSILRSGLSPLETEIALKEFRALVRRKDMARFLAIPVVIIIAFILPSLFTQQEFSGSSPGLFLAAFIPFLIPLMLSSITIGQEGKAAINLLMLPISSKELIKGKLLPAWTVSLIATVAVVGGFEILAPVGASAMIVTILAGIFVIAAESFTGLGVGSRYPDYTAGARSRYVTFTGFIISFLIGGVFTIAIFTPAAFYQITNGGIRDSVSTQPLSLTEALLGTILIGSVLTYLSYRYCKSGVEKFLSSYEE